MKMQKKRNNNLIKLLSSAKTGTFYISKKNKSSIKEKLALKKYDLKIRKHVLFHETRLSK
jgi:large subunit ribosomal protein L33